MIINHRPYSTAHQSMKVIVLQAPMPLLPQSRSTHHQPYHGSPTASAASDKKWNPLNPLGIVGRHFKADEPHLRIAMCWWVRRMMWRWAWCVGETGSHTDAPAPNCWWVRLGLLVNWVHLLLSSGDAPAEWKEDQQIKRLGNNLLEEMSARFLSIGVVTSQTRQISRNNGWNGQNKQQEWSEG